MDVHEAARLLEAGEAVALDVREPSEWRHGRIPGALHVPMSELPARSSLLPHDRAIIAVCRSGNRSGRVTSSLERLGFRIENLEGGLRAWRRAGLALDPPDGRVA
jgi:rhodanese-related sulfurtransferase